MVEDEVEEIEEDVPEGKELPKKRLVRRRKTKKEKESPLSSALRLTVETGKVEFGTKTGLKDALNGSSKLFVVAKEGFLEIINTGSNALEASVSMARLPANIVFNPKNQRIYLSYSSYNSVASFDINQNKVISILQNKTAVIKKPSFLTPSLLIGGFAAIFSIIAIWWILRKKDSLLNKIKT